MYITYLPTRNVYTEPLCMLTSNILALAFKITNRGDKITHTYCELSQQRRKREKRRHKTTDVFFNRHQTYSCKYDLDDIDIGISLSDQADRFKIAILIYIK